jgi:transcriptional regulator with XRE-family HTH domain
MEMEDYIKKIGENIIKRREELGIKQVELAHDIGIDDSSLRRIESGRTNPTFKTLYQIAEALKIEVVDLLQK